MSSDGRIILFVVSIDSFLVVFDLHSMRNANGIHL